MSIEWLRDLILCIFGLVATGVLIFLAVLLFLHYRRMKSILDSIRTILITVQRISSYSGDEIIKPMIQVVALIQGLRQGLGNLTKIFKK